MHIHLIYTLHPERLHFPHILLSHSFIPKWIKLIFCQQSTHNNLNDKVKNGFQEFLIENPKLKCHIEIHNSSHCWEDSAELKPL